VRVNSLHIEVHYRLVSFGSYQHQTEAVCCLEMGSFGSGSIYRPLGRLLLFQKSVKGSVEVAQESESLKGDYVSAVTLRNRLVSELSILREGRASYAQGATSDDFEPRVEGLLTCVTSASTRIEEPETSTEERSQPVEAVEFVAAAQLALSVSSADQDATITDSEGSTSVIDSWSSDSEVEQVCSPDDVAATLLDGVHRGPIDTNTSSGANIPGLSTSSRNPLRPQDELVWLKLAEILHVPDEDRKYFALIAEKRDQWLHGGDDQWPDASFPPDIHCFMDSPADCHGHDRKAGARSSV
jgi:hypothetical protein